jgi:hypothetical protein
MWPHFLFNSFLVVSFMTNNVLDFHSNHKCDMKQ